ncbi:hypothetical protein DL767_010634 [Monosporascus sp. MG133]|nr:hypothetical protein DL767_010634 [Monosporascus sp. MG133]
MPPKRIITVFGATGLQGGAVASTFLTDVMLKGDWAVRAVTRDASKEAATKLAEQGAEVVVADYDDKVSLVNAMRGSDVAFGVTNYYERADANYEIQQGKNLADAAKDAGIKQYIWSSLLNITELSKGKLPNVYHFDSKAEVEEYVRSLGIPATFFLPGFYMSNIGRVGGLLQPLPPDNNWTFTLPAAASAQIPMFHVGDTGKFIKAIVLNRDRVLGKRVLGATTYMTAQEVVDSFRTLFPKAGSTAYFFQLSEDMFRETLKSQGLSDYLVTELYENLRLLEEFGYYGGNLHQVPKEKGYKRFQQWAAEYGPIYSLVLGGTVVVVISSEYAMRDLLEKRGAIYSSRPDQYLSHDILSGGLRVVFMKYNKTLRLARKVARMVLDDDIVRTTYLAYQDLESRDMLHGLLEKPDEFINHLKKFTTSFTTQIVFGYRTPNEDDPFMKKLFYTANLLNIFPVLRRLPDSLLPVRRLAKELHKSERNLFLGMYMDVKRKLNEGTAKPCAAAMLAELQETEGVSDDTMAYFSGSLLQAGSETTMATLLGFVQAMVIFPEVAKAAQAEIDGICGNRLPSLDDRKDLPYIRGCVKESLRWMPTTILGVPHSVDKEDWSEEEKTRKENPVSNAVTRTIHKDPKRYRDPYNFDPSRWANDDQSSYESARNEDVTKRDHYAFGMGRRMCLAMNLVDQSLFLAISRLLWAFDFKRAIDVTTQQEIVPDMDDLFDGLFTMPNPFRANIVPRGQARAQSIQEDWHKTSAELLDGDMQWKDVPVGSLPTV